MIAITYEGALQRAEDWALGTRNAAPPGAHAGHPSSERLIAEAMESIKWSILAVAIAAGEPETKAGQR